MRDREMKRATRLLWAEARGLGGRGEIRAEFPEGLTIIAGANSSGKTMLLELAWWALTGDMEPVSRYCREGAELSAELDAGKTLRARDVEGVWEQKRSGGPPMVRALHFGANGGVPDLGPHERTP